ncbi:hypothetical protein GRJ2_001439800 [Grus japonensis]|uniref:Uncharacterized protein n=1 Tax=Grus japonensis TaxID=30415 RepID=A0ABC9WWB7_GRUJA
MSKFEEDPIFSRIFSGQGKKLVYLNVAACDRPLRIASIWKVTQRSKDKALPGLGADGALKLQTVCHAKSQEVIRFDVSPWLRSIAKLWDAVPGSTCRCPLLPEPVPFHLDQAPELHYRASRADMAGGELLAAAYAA